MKINSVDDILKHGLKFTITGNFLSIKVPSYTEIEYPPNWFQAYRDRGLFNDNVGIFVTEDNDLIILKLSESK